MRTSRKPRFVLVFLLALCALFVYGYTARLDELAGLQAKIVTMQARIDDAKQEQTKLESVRADIAGDDYLDRAAREIFDYGKEGDRLVVPIAPGEGAARAVTGGMAMQPGSANVTAALFDPHDLPVWQQWVAFFAESHSAFRLSNARPAR
ncbi:MAG: septum formation initiator family protein [Caldilineaceae bacterium]|nr:septum formation initiator family protein [Caldilineaceae bacterium]